MSVFWTDGYDTYDTDIRKYSLTSSGTLYTYSGSDPNYAPCFNVGRCMLFSSAPNYIGVGHSNAATLLFCTHFKIASNNANCLLSFVEFMDASTVQVAIYLDGTSSPFFPVLKIYVGSTLVATSSAALPIRKWCWISVKCTVGVSGFVEVKVNDTVYVSYSGNTANSGNSYANAILWGCFSRSGDGCDYVFDNTLLVDTAGSIANDHMPECRIYFGVPTANGDEAQWTPSSGSNYQCVDDTVPNDDGDYNHSSTNGDKDTFVVGNLTASLPPTIYAVTMGIYARKDDAVARSINPVSRRSSTDYDWNTQAINVNYETYLIETRELDPSTSAQWTAANVQNTQWGYKNHA